MTEAFQYLSVRSEGALFPTDLLAQIGQQTRSLPGLTGDAYHLVAGERLSNTIDSAWSQCRAAWNRLHDQLAGAPVEDASARLTRERWLLPLFSALGYGRLPFRGSLDVEDQSYPISHLWHRSPIHLLGGGTELDKRTRGVVGAAAASPHGLVQDFLNRSEDHLWGFLANATTLRVLRDHHSLTRQAYVEFDLQAIFEGEQYSDFTLLWMLCHQSRVEADTPDDCWLEVWRKEAGQRGVGAREDLRQGVQDAIEALGQGFTEHRKNGYLQDQIAGEGVDELYRQLLRLVYRLIFVFVAEDREVLHSDDADTAAKALYHWYYSTRRLRQRSWRGASGAKHDLWIQLQRLFRGLHEGAPALGLPALGGRFFAPDETPWLTDSLIANEQLLRAIAALSQVRRDGATFPIDWRNQLSDELGSVYESLLELHPVVEDGTFRLVREAGSARKTSGSYYTPTSLVELLIESALDPVLDRAARGPAAEERILALKVCDPACGSGHFLVAAARRIAHRLAAVRAGGEPSPAEVRQALRDVTGRCLYGVDLNPMAVELCKVSLWMEALEPGRPLSFLQEHILCGNGLLGATPRLLAEGIPKDAFGVLTGDDKETAKAQKRKNATELRGQTDMFSGRTRLATGLSQETMNEVRRLETAGDRTAGAAAALREKWAAVRGSANYQHAQFVADLWCAAFVWPRHEGAPAAITQDVFRSAQRDPAGLPEDVREEVARLAAEYRFFHWHLGFPGVFQVDDVAGNPHTGWSGGFDVVAGNPPWERVALQEKEFFAGRHAGIAEAPNKAARTRMIRALAAEDPVLFAEFEAEKRQAEGTIHLLLRSGHFPLCGRGDVNTYSVFAEQSRHLIDGAGRVGLILPTGIVTENPTRFFAQDLVESGAIESLYDFQNRERLFSEVASNVRFCVATFLGRDQRATNSDFVFLATNPTHVRDEERRFQLTPDQVEGLNPNTKTLPTLTSARDARLLARLHERLPILERESPLRNPWEVTLGTLFHMSGDSGLFRTADELRTEGATREGVHHLLGERRFVPLMEAKLLHQFDWRFADFRDETGETVSSPVRPTQVQREDPAYEVTPRYWVPVAAVEDKLPEGWDAPFVLGWRNICRSTDERTVIPFLAPRYGFGHSVNMMYPGQPHRARTHLLAANLSSFALDYCARQKLSGVNLTFGVIRQFPVLPPEIYVQPAPWRPDVTLDEWMTPRIVELVHTGNAMTPWARSVGDRGEPRTWDEARRRDLRAELDAAFFILYGLDKADASYILEGFEGVHGKDVQEFGDKRTMLLVLEAMERLTNTCEGGA